jgi:hypothetical protein
MVGQLPSLEEAPVPKALPNSLMDSARAASSRPRPRHVGDTAICQARSDARLDEAS